MRFRVPRLVPLVVSVLLSFPLLAAAQSTGAISGQATDTTGAVLPGVTVEAASPALIERVRTAVTDASGLYAIEGLRPGTYSVTFTLSGFATFRREGIELAAGFTAPVNAEMRVGSLEETVTVTGASPTVDVRNVRTQVTLDTNKTLNVLPNSQNLSALSALILGSNATGNATGGVDVGGAGGEMGQTSLHNNRGTDMKITQEGMNTMTSFGNNGGNIHFGQHYNMEGVAEIQLQTNGAGADTETAGMQINYIPKEGGNSFSASGRFTYTNTDFQSGNLSPELQARGATSPPSIRRIYDYGGGLGGPIARDRLWFYTAHRWWSSEQFSPGSFYNKVQGQKAPNGRPLYEPDLSRPAYVSDPSVENSGRLTWQVTPKDKVTYFGNRGDHCVCIRLLNATRSPEASQNTKTGPGQHLSQATYSRPHTNRVLVEGGFSWLNNPFVFARTDGVGQHDIEVMELSPLFIYNAFGSSGIPPYNEGDPSQTGQMNGRGAVSYITGSHSFKFGFMLQHGILEQNGSINTLPGFGPLNFQTLNGVPVAVDLWVNPQYRRSDFLNSGYYAQDQWALRNFTINLGVRFDLFEGWSPDQDSPDTAYVKGFHVNRIEGTPSWKDVSPRLGFAWDVTSDNRTAVKVAAGRYVSSQGGGFAQSMNPANAISTRTLRTWNDADNDFFPDGDPANPAANGELGPSQNPLFGTPVITRFFDDDMVTKNRPYTWQMSAGVERELRENMRIAITYFRTSHRNQTVNDNQSIAAVDHDAFCVTVPNNPALPNAGSQLCGFADVSFAGLRRAPRTLTRTSKTFGDWSEVYNGADIELNARFGNGGLIQGGTSFGRTVNDRCFVVDSPQELYQCRTVAGLAANTQFKLSGAYPLPWGLSLSGVYQNLTGPEVRALVTFTNAQIAPSLGRNLSRCAAPTGACNATVSLDVIPDRFSEFEERTNMLDFRVMKDFTQGLRGARVRLTLDLYNALNANPVLTVNNNYGTNGATWLRPTAILSGRLVKLGAQLNW